MSRKRNKVVIKMYKDLSELPLSLTVKEFADVLNINRNTAYAVIRSKEISSIRIGKQIRISKSALIEYLNKTD